MIDNWRDMLDIGLDALPPLHGDILRRTLAIPGKRRALFYKEGLELYNLDRGQFELERNAALEGLRIYFQRHGITGIDDLAL